MTYTLEQRARKVFGKYCYVAVKDDMDIQLKRGQFYWAVNSLCAKFRGILQGINVASKLVYSYCCSFYGCQLWDLFSNYIEDIYVAWQKAIRRIFNLPYNTHWYLLPFVAGLTISLMHWCLVTIRSLSFWCTTAISVIVHWVSIENSWICTIVINAMKSEKLMRYCFCHYWMLDAQIGLFLSFRKMRLNVWFMIFVSINLDILWWYIF